MTLVECKQQYDSVCREQLALIDQLREVNIRKTTLAVTMTQLLFFCPGDVVPDAISFSEWLNRQREGVRAKRSS